MTKDVLISISGLQFAEGQNSSVPVEVIAGADYFRQKNSHYVLYDEVSEGMEGITQNTIKVKNQIIEIMKKGNSNVHMVFEKGKKNLTYYETPYGNLLISILANDIQILEEDDEIKVTIDYLLEANHEPLADCKIKMKITSKEKSGFSLES